MFDDSEMKCPFCGVDDYECVDMKTDFMTPKQVTITWLCYCEKCKTDFEIISTYVFKSTRCEKIIDD